MRWIRGNKRHGSWLALFALVVNLSLSFGHVHPIDGRHAESGLVSLIGAAFSHTDRTQGHRDESQPDYLCPICTAVSAIANAVISAPPSLPVEFAVVNLDQPAEVSQLFAAPPTAAFQSRGPPIS